MFLNSSEIMHIALFWIILRIFIINFFLFLYSIINDIYQIEHSNNNVNKIMF